LDLSLPTRVETGLLTVALVAALVEAWRASRLDPTIALRD